MKTKHLQTKTLSFLISFLLFFSISAQAQKEKLQTAFIYQLTRMIEWCPEGKEGNFTIAILGNDPNLQAELSQLNGRRIGNQIVEIKSFSSAESIEKANIVFIPNSQYDNLEQISSTLANSCALIVAERSGAARRGAGVSIPYNTIESKLEFEISKSYMRDRSLNVNNQLYSLATRTY